MGRLPVTGFEQRECTPQVANSRVGATHAGRALPSLPGRELAGLTVARADDFGYTDPVDGSTSRGQGLRVFFADGSRIVLRLSGTGTSGATLRVYLDRYSDNPATIEADTSIVLADLARAADEIAEIAKRTGRTAPDLVT